MQTRNAIVFALFLCTFVPKPAFAQHEQHQAPDDAGASETAAEPILEPSHGRPGHAAEEPPLPEGMSLDEVLNYAAAPTPSHFPDPVDDDSLNIFTLIEQIEFRIPDEGGGDELGWESQGWIGYDYDRFVWKSEGEISFVGADEGETETDLLYSRLITPFWNLQAGVQYANEWESTDYEDRWSGVLALQGIAPGTFEIDSSLYISEDADVVYQLEAEYNIRLTQRLVLQPRTELGFAFQDIPQRALGAGLTDVNLDLRLRFELEREIAPYIGVRYRMLTGETADIADSAGIDTENFWLIFGVRFAF